MPRSAKRPQLTVVGYPFLPIGMGEHMRSAVRAMRAVGLDPRLVDVADFPGPPDADLERDFAGAVVEGLGDLNVFCVNGDECQRVIDRLGREAFAGARNIVYPAWELSQYPAEWARTLAQFDEHWAPSVFVRDAMSEALRRPVYDIPLPVELNLSSFLGRRRFGIPEDAFVVLFSFDFSSYAERKNPGAVLDAYERVAARRPEARLHCVIKSRGRAANAAARAAFEARIAALGSRVQVIDGDLSDNEIKNLIRACDVFVSLHRSEGFGRGMAEAMALGRPSIATGYSGNLDFMTPDTGLLVDYELVPVAPGAYPFGEGQVWADASVEHAADLIEQLLDNPASGRALGQRARTRIRTHFSYRAIGLRYLERLERMGV